MRWEKRLGMEGDLFCASLFSHKFSSQQHLLKKNSVIIFRQQLTFLTNNRFAAVIWFLIGPTLERKMSNFGGITYKHRTIIYYHLTVITIIPSTTDVHISKFPNKKIIIKERDIYIERGGLVSSTQDKSGFAALVDRVLASATPW